MAKPKAKGKAAARRAPASRQGRAAELARQRERRSLRNRLIAAALFLAGAGTVIFFAATAGEEVPPITSASCTEDTRHDRERTPIHIANPVYEASPPAGGQHTPRAARPGFYREGDVVPSDGELVHAMEHGFVVLWYRPDLGAEDMAAIERLSDEHGRTLIVVPRLSLGGPIAVTAWHHRLLCRDIDAGAVSQFTRNYADKGPETGFL